MKILYSSVRNIAIVTYLQSLFYSLHIFSRKEFGTFHQLLQV